MNLEILTIERPDASAERRVYLNFLLSTGAASVSQSQGQYGAVPHEGKVLLERVDVNRAATELPKAAPGIKVMHKDLVIAMRYTVAYDATSKAVRVSRALHIDFLLMPRRSLPFITSRSGSRRPMRSTSCCRLSARSAQSRKPTTSLPLLLRRRSEPRTLPGRRRLRFVLPSRSRWLLSRLTL